MIYERKLYENIKQNFFYYFNGTVYCTLLELLFYSYFKSLTFTYNRVVCKLYCTALNGNAASIISGHVILKK